MTKAGDFLCTRDFFSTKLTGDHQKNNCAAVNRAFILLSAIECNSPPGSYSAKCRGDLQNTIVDLLIEHGAIFTQNITDQIDWKHTLRKMRDATPPILARFEAILKRVKAYGANINKMCITHPPTQIHHLTATSNGTKEVTQLSVRCSSFVHAIVRYAVGAE